MDGAAAGGPAPLIDMRSASSPASRRATSRNERMAREGSSDRTATAVTTDAKFQQKTQWGLGLGTCLFRLTTGRADSLIVRRTMTRKRGPKTWLMISNS